MKYNFKHERGLTRYQMNLVMKTILKHLHILLLLSLISQCKKGESNDEFSFGRKEYIGSELRTDGYYYFYYPQGNYYNIYFLYTNGISLYGEAVNAAELNEYETAYKNGVFFQRAKNDLSYWGIFEVESNKFKMETKGNDGNGIKVRITSGYILNDTSFQLTKSMRVNGENARTINELYQFKSFRPKPDSTNNYIP